MYFVTIGPLFILRDKCEGIYYQTSYSAQLGDGGLIVIVLMVSEILKRGGVLPSWMQSAGYQALALIVGTVLGLVWFSLDNPKQWADKYHHLVIAPLLCYLGITLVPAIWFNGTRVELFSMYFLVTLWAVLCRYDAKTHRLDQRNYRALGLHLDEMNNSD